MNRQALSHCFSLTGHQVISVIGSGGKTSLIRYLSRQYSQEKVLCSTTTKIACPKPEDYTVLYTDSYEALGSDGPGIVVAGETIGAPQKLTMPTAPAFRRSFPYFDKVFLEADGSKQLPLKGWADFEPVVLPETTITVGILPLPALQQPASEKLIHRWPLFQEITGLSLGEAITNQTLRLLLSHPKGLWKAAEGARILYLNQVETEGQQQAAAELVAEMQSANELKGLSKLIVGSIKQEKGLVLWGK